ncbi:MAG TPA: lytic transglycosylase domain-containing protein [Bryobacteraceae bacterium]|jgi:soluble lytic murein transglycosylase-like protein|nr:lytic transglycosylase domain-containing protein [Bryobacteraceae bacterium]
MPINPVMIGYATSYRFWAKLCLSLVLADALSAQTVSQQLPTRPTPDEQYARAMAAMQGSLDRQQRSVRTALSRLAAAPSAEAGTAGDSVSQEPEQTAASDSFFAAPWPAPEPLTIPNVQVLDEDCTPLETKEIDRLAEQAGSRNGVSADLLKSVMRQESGFKPCALSIVGAMGLMQVMPETAETLHLDDPFDPAKNVDAGARFLRMMLDRYQGDTQLALGAYNAGPARVDKSGGVPAIPETVDYINKVLAGVAAQR